jgi:hypothetical protein
MKYSHVFLRLWLLLALGQASPAFAATAPSEPKCKELFESGVEAYEEGLFLKAIDDLSQYYQARCGDASNRQRALKMLVASHHYLGNYEESERYAQLYTQSFQKAGFSPSDPKPFQDYVALFKATPKFSLEFGLSAESMQFRLLRVRASYDRADYTQGYQSNLAIGGSVFANWHLTPIWRLRAGAHFHPQERITKTIPYGNDGLSHEHIIEAQILQLPVTLHANFLQNHVWRPELYGGMYYRSYLNTSEQVAYDDAITNDQGDIFIRGRTQEDISPEATRNNASWGAMGGLRLNFSPRDAVFSNTSFFAAFESNFDFTPYIKNDVPEQGQDSKTYLSFYILPDETEVYSYRFTLGLQWTIQYVTLSLD